MHTPQARCGRSLATFLALQAVICQILYLRTASLAALTVSLPCTTGAFALAFGLARRASRAPHAAQHVAKRSPCERQRPVRSSVESHPLLCSGRCRERAEPLPPGSHSEAVAALWRLPKIVDFALSTIQAQYRRVVHRGS